MFRQINTSPKLFQNTSSIPRREKRNYLHSEMCVVDILSCFKHILYYIIKNSSAFLNYLYTFFRPDSRK
jgi:hypothetical protein